MLVDKDSFGDPRNMTKWVLTGVLVGALLVLITQIVTKCMP